MRDLFPRKNNPRSVYLKVRNTRLRGEFNTDNALKMLHKYFDVRVLARHLSAFFTFVSRRDLDGEGRSGSVMSSRADPG